MAVSLSETAQRILAFPGAVAHVFDQRASGYAPWQVAVGAVGAYVVLSWVVETVTDDETLYAKATKTVFKFARRLPLVRRKIEESIKESQQGFEHSLLKVGHGVFGSSCVRAKNRLRCVFFLFFFCFVRGM